MFFLYKPYPDAQEIIIHKEELIDFVYKLQQKNPEEIKKRKAQDGDTNLFSYGARSLKSLGDNSARAALRQSVTSKLTSVSKMSRMSRQSQVVVSITPWKAVQIPGVLQYGFAFFCVKFSIYAFLLNLPLMMTELLQYEPQRIANMQTANDIGSLFGGALIGTISDFCYQKRAPVAVASIIIAALLVATLTVVIE